MRLVCTYEYDDRHPLSRVQTSGILTRLFMIQSSAAASEEEESEAAAINWQSNGLGFSFYTPAQVFCVAQILNFFLAFLHPVPSCNCGAFISLSSQRRFYKPSSSVGAATAAAAEIGYWLVVCHCQTISFFIVSSIDPSSSAGGGEQQAVH